MKGCWPSRTVERKAGSESGSDIHPRYPYHYKARSSIRKGFHVVYLPCHAASLFPVAGILMDYLYLPKLALCNYIPGSLASRVIIQ